MATAQRRKPRRRRTTKSTPLGKESWQIVDQDGNVLRDLGYSEGAVVGVAQGMAQHHEDPVTLNVRLKPLFGDPDVFYRVVRDEDGNIWTHAVRS